MAQSTNPEIQADRLRRHQRALADFGLEAFRASELEGLLQRAASMVSAALEVDLVKIMELMEDRQELLIRAGVNWKPGVVGEVTLSATPASPAGYALLTDEAVISPDVATETRFSIPPVLQDHGVQSMVNVIIAGNERPFGVLEVDAREHRQFDADDIAFLRNYANLLAAAVDRLRTHSRLAEALEHRQFLLLELQHRVKNILALVQALASRPSAADRTAEEFRETFLDRLHALAQSHSLLFGDCDHGADLRHLVEQMVQPYRTGAPEAVTVEGEEIPVSAKQGLALGLILHELCTNAAKYGALTHPDGRVRVAWAAEDASATQVRLNWEERHGPPVTPPDRQGLGTRMIERSAAHDLNGHAELRYAPQGFTCEILFPLRSEEKT